MLYLEKLSNEYNCNIYLKLEKYNLSGSIKDRAVKEIILSLIKENKINKDTTIIEATSGNTGISLACICASLNLKCIIVMPNDSNVERINLIKLHGAKIVLTDSKDKMNGSIKKAKEINKTIKNSIILSQFSNINNLNAHYKYTAKEIIDDVNNIDGFFASFGTSGSLSGICKKLKEYNKNIKTVCVLPNNKKHKIVGVYSNNKPLLLKKEYIDESITVDDVDSYVMVKKIAQQEGIGLGLSSGLILQGAIQYLKKQKLKNIVILCPDGIERYLSNQFLFNDYQNTKEIYEDIDKMYDLLFVNQDFDNDLFLKYQIKRNIIKRIYNNLIKDATFIYENDPSASNANQVINCYSCFYAIFIYRISNYLYNNVDKLLARIISEYGHMKTGIDIHPNATIKVPFAIDHGSGIVIGETTLIGKNVRLYQGVTLGALSLNKPNSLRNKKRHPTIKNNVIIYEKASILGGKTIIGNNVIIGNNITITSSIPDNKIVSKNKNNYEIIEKKDI